MGKKIIYILRHGQTELNRFQLLQGRGSDAPLNVKGRMQAEVFYNMHNHIPFQKIYSSTLKRSFESVDKFITEKNIPLVKLSGLDEIDWGEKEGTPWSTGDGTYFEVTNKWKAGETDVLSYHKGGESPDQVQERQKKDWVQIENGKEDLILVIMHGRAMRILLCLLMNKPLIEMHHFPHRNLCYYKLEYDVNALEEKYKILKMCETRYLREKDLLKQL